MNNELTDNEVNKIIAEFMGEDVAFLKIREVDGYYICSNGDVVSMKYGRPKRIKQHTGNSGYLKVTFSVNNKSINYMTHYLVAKYFIKERPEGYQINHKDGNKLNNDWKNLEYVTQYENMKHAVKMRLHKPVRGESHYSAKLKDYEVNDIRLLYMKNKAQILSYFYGVSESHIRKILKGKTRKTEELKLNEVNNAKL